MDWILVVLGLIVLLYVFAIRPYTFWTKRGVIQKSLLAQWIDNIHLLFGLKSLAEVTSIRFDEFPDKRYIGTYQLFQPILYLRDPELIKQIAVKDFDHFVDHNQFITEEQEPLWGKNLLSLRGERWRDMRATLSPSFTSSKMRSMFTLINHCAEQLTDHLRNEEQTGQIDTKDFITRFANDVIASIAFGITCDSLKDRENEFYLMGKEATVPQGLWRKISFFIILFSPKLSKLFSITPFPAEVTDFFRRLVKSNIESREKNEIIRPDMIHLMMEARKGVLKHEDVSEVIDSGFAVIEESSVGKQQKAHKRQLTDEDITAQALFFFFAGFESVSSQMCFILYELAVNPDIQVILRKEVDETLANCKGDLTYESILRMKYLDMVVSEGLRKWPPIIATDRQCVKPYTLQPAEGELPVSIEMGDRIWLPVFAIHRNYYLYPNPDKFDPERFSDANKSKIHPYAYIPFGAGPRSCIANRFALLEIKTVVFHLLSHFELRVTEKTSIPIKISKTQFNLSSAKGFWLGLNPRAV